MWEDFLYDLPGILCFLGSVVMVLLPFIFLKFDVSPEGWIVTVKAGGPFKKCVLTWRGHKLDKDWNVVKGFSPRLPFGIFLVGIRGIHKVDKVFSAKPLDMTVLVEKAETKPPERIPLNIPFFILFQFVNGYKAGYASTEDIIETIRKCLHALFRGWISNRSYDFIINCHQSAETIWKGEAAYVDQGDPANNIPPDPSKNKPAVPGLWNDPEIIALEQKFGVHIIENGIKIMDVGFTDEYQRDLALKEEKRLKAEALAKQVEVLITSSMAKARTSGKIDGPDGFVALLASDTKLQESYEKKCEALTNRLLAQEDGSYIEAHGTIEAGIMSILTKWEQAKAAAQANASGTPPSPLGGHVQRHRRGRGGNNPPTPAPQPPQNPPQGGQGPGNGP